MKCPMRKVITTAYSEPASYDCGYPNNTKLGKNLKNVLVKNVRGMIKVEKLVRRL